MAEATRHKVPASLGGGEISKEALKLCKHEVFRKVPQPELIAECVVRVLMQNNNSARTGLRGVANYYRGQNRHGKLVMMIEKVMKYER